MSRRKTFMLAALLWLPTLVLSAGASANTKRALLVASQTLEGKPVSAAELENATLARLGGKRVRWLDLDVALSSQKALFSDMLAKGVVPPELSTLNADAVVSTRLECAKSADALLGSKFQSYFCTLHTKILRVDTGDITFSRSESFAAHGLNAAMAIRGAIQTKVGTALAAHGRTWLEQADAEAPLHADLMISGIRDLGHRDQLRAALESLAPVSEARAVYLRDGVAKLDLTVSGSDALGDVVRTLDSGDFGLRITREAGRSLHAQVDLRRAMIRDVVVALSVASPGSQGRELSADLGPDILQSALRDLPYLQPVHARPLTVPSRKLRALVRVRQGQEAPLVLVASMREVEGQWRVRLKLSDMGEVQIASGSASSHELEEATRNAVSDLDEALLAAYTGNTPVNSSWRMLSRPNGMRIRHFAVGGRNGATLTLHNTGDTALSECSVALTVAGLEAGQLACPALAPGERRTVKLAFTALPKRIEEDRHTNVTAEVSYRAGEAYAQAGATTVWVRDRSGASRHEHAATAAAETYDRLTKQGVRASRSGEFAKAKRLFLRAHRRLPTARTLRALAMVSFDLGEYTASERYVRRALTSNSRPLTPTMREQLELLSVRTRAALSDRNIAMQ